MEHTLFYDMHHHTVTYDDEVIYLYRLEVQHNLGYTRELFITASERDRFLKEYADYLEGTLVQVSITVKHWIGIEPRTFVVPLGDISFLY